MAGWLRGLVSVAAVSLGASVVYAGAAGRAAWLTLPSAGFVLAQFLVLYAAVWAGLRVFAAGVAHSRLWSALAGAVWAVALIVTVSTAAGSRAGLWLAGLLFPGGAALRAVPQAWAPRSSTVRAGH